MVHVRLVAMGNIISELNSSRIIHWKSRLFTIEKEVKRGVLPPRTDSYQWAYSDVLLEKSFSKISQTHLVDLTFYILDSPIQDNYSSRILTGNKIVLTYHKTKEMLQKENIPLENYLISRIYAYVLLYLTKSDKKLIPDDERIISHDYTAGCLFDMCGVKSDIIYKSVQPNICEVCKAYLISHGVSIDDINIAEQEQKRLKRTPYYRIVRQLKTHPFMGLFLSCCLALVLNLVASVIFKLFF